MAQPEATLSREHLRAICDEIGDRFRDRLDGDMPDPPQRIRELLVLLDLSERSAPSPSEAAKSRPARLGELTDA